MFLVKTDIAPNLACQPAPPPKEASPPPTVQTKKRFGGNEICLCSKKQTTPQRQQAEQGRSLEKINTRREKKVLPYAT